MLAARTVGSFPARSVGCAPPVVSGLSKFIVVGGVSSLVLGPNIGDEGLLFLRFEAALASILAPLAFLTAFSFPTALRAFVMAGCFNPGVFFCLATSSLVRGSFGLLARLAIIYFLGFLFQRLSFLLR